MVLVGGVPQARIHEPVVDRIAIGRIRGRRGLVGPVERHPVDGKARGPEQRQVGRHRRGDGLLGISQWFFCSFSGLGVVCTKV